MAVPPVARTSHGLCLGIASSQVSLVKTDPPPARSGLGPESSVPGRRETLRPTSRSRGLRGRDERPRPLEPRDPGSPSDGLPGARAGRPHPRERARPSRVLPWHQPLSWVPGRICGRRAEAGGGGVRWGLGGAGRLRGQGGLSGPLSASEGGCVCLCLLARVCLCPRQGTVSGWLGRPSRGEGPPVPGQGPAGLCRRGRGEAQVGLCVGMGPRLVGLLSGWVVVGVGVCLRLGCSGGEWP